MNSNKENYDEETVKKAKINVTSYIKNNYADIENLTVNDPYEAEMGIMTIAGKANGEDFSVSLDTELKIAGVAILSENFPKKKEECLEKICDY
ncbi:hypothetical protein [Pseudalkalibacillus hwajinpoensis]|uniref:DUF1433 domain-containing protein n=1 Tax=Guptibacillus hwajinpoensis TaxID=208199 RepID=A0A4U1MNC5_9BACL|nr:hypothetical protein [Pseudalkalibacillus hwajinpoensis]TKD72236.1 hypothetical protein FBF83_05435 [Pseudalkalibacillus hwajinpoensis]